MSVLEAQCSAQLAADEKKCAKHSKPINSCLLHIHAASSFEGAGKMLSEHENRYSSISRLLPRSADICKTPTYRTSSLSPALKLNRPGAAFSWKRRQHIAYPFVAAL
ncbi:uncharacterized protein ZBAI_08342 [Zygosaccharomyces bailii ISA1307]|nr:uncharacterized protein ZBAI_08342 [Zygosaccharomyces bailii ISA1307]